MIIGVAWYRPEQWDLFKSTASDPEIIEDTYKEWVASAEKTLREMRKSGLNPIKVDLDVEALIEWCQRNGKPQDGNSRTDFVIHLLEKMG